MKVGKETITVTNSAGIIYLAENAKRRNKSVYIDKLIRDIDPVGVHLLTIHFPHNDVEMRTLWLVKIKDADEPVEIWLDVEFDCLREVTTEIEHDNAASQ